MTTPNSLNVFTFPLHGQRLIEASAGTGKTFTIAGLYLRLLLGHGEANIRHPLSLSVDQILVVTFTEAATQELRSDGYKPVIDSYKQVSNRLQTGYKPYVEITELTCRF